MDNKFPIKIYSDNNRFTIDWTLNTLCTYRCSYCPPDLNQGKNIVFSKSTDEVIIRSFLEKLDTEIKQRSVHLFLNGGEPTISHLFEPIIDFCAKVGWTSYVNTNLSRSLDWWLSASDKVFKVTVSYHPEFATDEIFHKVEKLSQRVNLGVFVLMYPPFWNKSVAAFERFRSIPNITLEPSRVYKRNERQSDESYNYSNEQLDWLEQNSGLRIVATENVKLASERSYWGETYVRYNELSEEKLDEVEFVNLKKTNFKGWNCSIGQNHILIHGDGTIYSGTCSTSRKISTIKDFVKLPAQGVVCKTDWCMCTGEVMVNKERVSC